jgi:hypothetical protein
MNSILKNQTQEEENCYVSPDFHPPLKIAIFQH